MKERIQKYLLSLDWTLDNDIFKKTMIDQSRSFIINGVPQQKQYEAIIEYLGETTDESDDIICTNSYKINNDIIAVETLEDFEYFYKLIFR